MKNYKLFIGAVLFSLAGCSGLSDNFHTSDASSSDPTQKLLTFSVNDLQAADKIAKANGDTVASTCYEYLVPKVQALQTAATASTATVAGSASFAEVQRGVLAQVNNVKSGLNVACAPLVLDTAATLNDLGIKLGTAAAMASTGNLALLPVTP